MSTATKIKCRRCRGHGFLQPKDTFLPSQRKTCDRCSGSGEQDNVPPLKSKSTTQKYMSRKVGMEHLKKIEAI